MKRFAAAGVAVAFLSGAGLVAASAAGPSPERRPPEGPIEIGLTIRHSRFIPSSIEVPAGTDVRFVVDNTDPINHELIVGDQDVQDAHETGTETVHGSVPGEISVGAGAIATTTYRFDKPGTVLLGCHLPLHYTYGMRGEVSVT